MVMKGVRADPTRGYFSGPTMDEMPYACVCRFVFARMHLFYIQRISFLSLFSASKKMYATCY
jgi:hypothetical protein